MKSIFEEMGGTYRQVGDYFIPTAGTEGAADFQKKKGERER